jgi:hypothetical protein
MRLLRLIPFVCSKLQQYTLQNGIYRFNGKWKQRGFGKLEGRNIEHLETIERNGRLYYRLNVLRNTRLRSSIIQNRLEDIGIIRGITREINLNADRKRLWLGTLKSIDAKERLTPFESKIRIEENLYRSFYPFMNSSYHTSLRSHN